MQLIFQFFPFMRKAVFECYTVFLLCKLVFYADLFLLYCSCTNSVTIYLPLTVLLY